MRLFFLLCITMSCIGQTITVTTKVSNKQATLAYTAPSGSPCTVKVSQSNTLSPLAYDVDPTMFTGADSDSRSYALSNGTARVFVAGTGTTELALDSKYYSRALQVYTLYYYLVTCGVATGSGTFTTANLPVGNTRNDFSVPITSSNTWLWPTITNTRNQEIIDPQTGVLLTDLTIPSDSTGTGSGLYIGDGGMTRECADNLITAPDLTQGFMCGYLNDSGGGSIFYIIAATGQSRYLGPSPGGNPRPDVNLGWNVYRTDLTPNGLYYEQYAGTFTAGDMTLATPVLENQYGLCSALQTFDARFVPSDYICTDAAITANTYTSIFIQKIPGGQGAPGWYVVIKGSGGPPFNPACTTDPCPHIIAAWWPSDPSMGAGDCGSHNNGQVVNADGLIWMNIGSPTGNCPGIGYGGVVYWKYLIDPHGTSIIINPTAFNYGGHLDHGATGPTPNGPTYGYVSEGGTAYQTVLGYPYINYATATATPVDIIDANQPFAGATSPASYSEVKHPSWAADGTLSNSSLAQMFSDALPLGGGGTDPTPGANGITNCTLVSGQLYKCTSPQPVNRKQQDTLAASQAQAYIDISGPGTCPGSVTNCLSTTSSSAGKYCIPNAIGECVSGSAIGDIYVNPISTSSFQPYCYGGETPNISYPSVCITNMSMMMSSIAQFWGTGTTEASSKSRALTKGLALGPAFMPGYALAKALPDSSWMMFDVGLANTFSPSQVWAAKIPPYPVSDGVDRTTFIPGNVSITTPGSLGIATATAEFYYTEYGSGQQCTTRAETCLAVAPTVTASLPFYYKTTESYTKASCAISCTIALPVLPLHVAYWTVKFYDGGGSFVQNGDSGVSIEGNVITLGVIPLGTNTNTNFVGGGVRKSGK